MDIYSYNGLQPTYLFYAKREASGGIGKLFKFRKGQVDGLNSSILGKSYGNLPQLSTTSLSVAEPMVANSYVQQPALSAPILSLDLTIDYHKHATIL